MLMGQGAVASDEGFVALSRAATLEYFWGRDCPNFTGVGFAALSKLPALRGLAVSCKRVDDASLSLLPNFPALRELMPMDFQDAGFRHIGACEKLERLWCMYCRETTDLATEHIAGLRLKQYYAGLTQITDRSLEILSRMNSLEKVEFYECKNITDAGITLLARLPQLRELDLGGCPNVSSAVTTVFPAPVKVSYSP
jgi:F-box/leucine-rich repeat protein 14